MIKDVIDKQIHPRAEKALGQHMIVFLALMIWKELMFLTELSRFRTSCGRGCAILTFHLFSLTISTDCLSSSRLHRSLVGLSDSGGLVGKHGTPAFEACVLERKVAESEAMSNASAVGAGQSVAFVGCLSFWILGSRTMGGEPRLTGAE
jgi:hypothetical protein